MSGLRQLSASLHKNYVEKKRNIRTTCCEYMSHFLIIVLLIFGYNLSEELNYDEGVYSTIELSIPPQGLSSSGGNLNLYDVYTTATELLSGPLSVPDFDTYIQLSRTLSSLVAEDDITGLLQQSDFGQKYGNLLTLGALHFAPDSPEVDDLISYLNRTTLTFRTLVVHKHKSEQKALQYVQNHLEEYTFALIVLHTISPEVLNYDIRQNYTTLPNTNQVVNWISVGLDTQYQNYFLSGFLTLQSTIDQWAFSYVDNQITQSLGTNASLDESRECRKPSPMTMPFPTAAFNQNLFYQAVGFLLGLAMTSKGNVLWNE